MSMELGDRVRDVITGMEGVAVARTSWLHGCVRIGVQPEELKDGRPVEPAWFDEPQLEVIKPKHKAAPVTAPNADTSVPGGPRDDAAANRSDPTR